MADSSAAQTLYGGIPNRDATAFLKPPLHRLGVEELDQVVHLRRADVDERVAYEPICRLPLMLGELLQPVREGFDEPHPGQKILVAVVLHPGHQPQPVELLA